MDQLEQEFVISKRSTNIHFNNKEEVDHLVQKKKLEAADDDLSEIDDTEMKVVTTKPSLGSLIKNNQRNVYLRMAVE